MMKRAEMDYNLSVNNNNKCATMMMTGDFLTM